MILMLPPRPPRWANVAGCCWRVVLGGQGCCQTSCDAQDSPTAKNSPVRSVDTAELGEPGASPGPAPPPPEAQGRRSSGRSAWKKGAWSALSGLSPGHMLSPVRAHGEGCPGGAGAAAGPVDPTPEPAVSVTMVAFRSPSPGPGLAPPAPPPCLPPLGLNLTREEGRYSLGPFTPPGCHSG